MLFSALIVLFVSLSKAWITVEYADFYGLNKTCHQTWSLFEASFNLSKLSRIDFIQGNQLNICDGPDLICCNRMLEKNLSQLSVKQYRRAFLSRNLLPIKTNLINYAYNFDNLIEEIFQISRMEFEHEFNKTYTNARHLVADFDSFFNSLRSYYSEYEINLREIVKRLFSSVIRMTVALSASSSKSMYHKCLLTSSAANTAADTDLLLDSDARMQLESRLECALESARLFSAALTKLRDVVIELYAKFELQPRVECLNELTRTYTCSMCLSDRTAKKRALRPCFKTCLGTYKTCIDLDFNKLDSTWNLYINLMKNFSQTIEFKINFESAMSSLKYEILDIIFHYRVNSDLIVSKLKNKCSAPILEVSAAAANISYLDEEDRVLQTRKRRQKLRQRQRRHAADSSNESLKIKMHLFFIDLNSYLYNLTNYWSQLIPNACKSNAPGDSCWNGTHIISKNSTKLNILAHINSERFIKPQASNDSQALNRTFWAQIQMLKQFNAKLNRQIEKINVNERLFLAKSNFRDLVESISFYNSNNKQGKEMMENEENDDYENEEDEYADENDEEYDYYSHQSGKHKNRVVTNLKLVPKSKDQDDDYYDDDLEDEDDYGKYDDEHEYEEDDEDDYYDTSFWPNRNKQLSAELSSNKSRTYPRIAQKVKDFLHKSANRHHKATSNLFLIDLLLFIQILVSIREF